MALLDTYIHGVLIIDGNLYSRVYGRLKLPHEVEDS